MSVFVLVHAAATDSWYWGPLMSELERLGHEAVAVDLPCEDDAKDPAGTGRGGPHPAARPIHDPVHQALAAAGLA